MPLLETVPDEVLNERPINSTHEAFLKRALKLEDHEPLPNIVKEYYWQVSTTARRMHVNVSERELIMVLMLANRPTPEDPVSFLDDTKEIKRGERVLAKFRGKWHWGKYVRTTAQKGVVVEIDQTSTEHEFKPTGVRFPSKEEMKGIGE